MYTRFHTNIIMSYSFVFILNMIFVSYVQSDVPQLICGYTGADGSYVFTYNMNVEEIPLRCNDIFYGGYYFNGTQRAQEATDIANLKKASKTVWLMYMCQDPKELATIACSTDASALDKYLEPTVKYLKDNKVDGVLLSELALHDGKIPGYTKVVETLICRIKKCVPNIKVGLAVYAYFSDTFADKKIFDFTITNPIVDFYFIDMSTLGQDCKPNLNAQGGKLPAKVLEKVFNGVSSSAMDKNKILSYALDYTFNSGGYMKPYSDYCNRKGSGYWCADNIKNIYDQVTLMKKYVKGIIIIYLDVDDFNNSCGCGLFPIANTIIAAWEGDTMPKCPALC